MANPQIQIRWDSDMREDYSASVKALYAYNPVPELKVSLTIKGHPSESVLRQIVGIANDHELDVGLLLTATWEKDGGPSQLRLFPPEGIQGEFPVETDEGEKATVTIKSEGQEVTVGAEALAGVGSKRLQAWQQGMKGDKG